MEFCPDCCNLLRFEKYQPPFRFCCSTCPYAVQIVNKAKIKRKQHLIKKEIEEIVTQEELLKEPTTDETCPNCRHGKAHFRTAQTRGADEPESRFYTCEKCHHGWREE